MKQFSLSVAEMVSDRLPGQAARSASAAAQAQTPRRTTDYSVQIEGVTKSFKKQIVLDDMNLTIGKGEFLTLLGPSGCGKSTTLNIIAGFLSPDSGTIYLRGRNANRLPPRRRRLGMVFQSWALFPHMSVFENVAYGLRARGMNMAHIRGHVLEMLQLVRLSPAVDKYPSQLSGGMQQRVALARALVTSPDVLLLDEPLSNLDAGLRKEMQIEIKRIHEQLKVTTVLVTHSQEEALVMSDTVAVMRGGCIEQIASPVDIYRNPRNAFVCTFVGNANILTGHVKGSEGDGVIVDVEGRTLRALSPNRPVPAAGSPVTLALRPEWIEVATPDQRGGADNFLSAEVLNTVFLGDRLSYEVSVGSLRFSVLCAPSPEVPIYQRGDTIGLRFSSRNLQILEDDRHGGH